MRFEEQCETVARLERTKKNFLILVQFIDKTTAYIRGICPNYVTDLIGTETLAFIGIHWLSSTFTAHPHYIITLLKLPIICKAVNLFHSWTVKWSNVVKHI